MSHEHYFIDVSAYDRVDVYRLIELAGITCPVAQHVFKKAFATGKRGHKDLRRDWQDIADSAARRLQMISEDEATFGQQNTIDCRSAEQKAGQVDSVFSTDCMVCGGRHYGLQCPHLRATAGQVGA